MRKMNVRIENEGETVKESREEINVKERKGWMRTERV